MIETISAVTSLGYIGAGWLTRKDIPPVGMALALLGIASLLFHWTGYVWAQAADEIAMYLVFTAFIGYEISGDNTFTGIFAAGLTLLTGLFYQQFDSHSMVPFLFLALFLVRAWKRRSLLFSAAFGAGGICWIIAKSNAMFADLLHGIWHILTAIGFSLI